MLELLRVAFARVLSEFLFQNTVCHSDSVQLLRSSVDVILLQFGADSLRRSTAHGRNTDNSAISGAESWRSAVATGSGRGQWLRIGRYEPLDAKCAK